jgi:hypothetical protein
VGVGVFSSRSRDVALALCPARSLSRLFYVTPSLTALLGAALLSAPHRHGHEEDHQHDGDCHHDYDDAGANRKYDKGGGHASPSQWTVAQLTSATVKSEASLVLRLARRRLP